MEIKDRIKIIMEKETIIEVNFTPEEEKLINDYATSKNMTVSEFIIDSVMNKIKNSISK